MTRELRFLSTKVPDTVIQQNRERRAAHLGHTPERRRTSSENLEILSNQLRTFLEIQRANCLERHVPQREKKLVQEYFEWAFQFISQYVASREQRALESTSPEVEFARQLAKAYIGEGNHDFFVTCIDGRNMPVTMFSRPPHIGGVYRAPAGIVHGFTRGVRLGTVHIDHKSPVVERLEKLLLDRPDQTVFYGYDSHLGCKARGEIHNRRGGAEKDSGVRSDVISKMLLAQGLYELRQKLVEDGKSPAEVIPTFFSYGSESGYMVAGLEMHVDDDEVAEVGYTTEMLAKLDSEGRIVSTETLLNEPEILSQVEAVIAPASADFRGRYGQSLKSNWEAITALYANGEGPVFQTILERLRMAYQVSGWSVDGQDDFLKKAISERTLAQKAKFLLKNMVTRYSIAGTKHEWPFRHHAEELVVITEGGYAPFPSLDAFSVFSQDLDSLLENTRLAIELIRNSRTTGQVVDPTGMFLTPEEFKSAPVFVSNKAIMRFKDEKTWTQLQGLDLSGVFSAIDWDSDEVLDWNRQDILERINQIHGIEKVSVNLPMATAFVNAVYEVFDRMRRMMKNKLFKDMILAGEIIVMNTIVDYNRRPRLIVPLTA